MEKEIEEALKSGDLSKTSEAIHKSLKDIDNTELNIAVTGESGAGKSTFINAIRGIEDDEPGAAKTGVVETTNKPMPYPHLKLNKVIFWDLPGVGTDNFQPKDYLTDVCFNRYDFFIIMSSARFRHNDSNLAKEIQAMGKKLYFVRNKIEADLIACQKRKKTFNEENTLKEMREDCIKNLQKSGIQEPHVFLLSCLELEKYDFNEMQDILAKELTGNKRHAFIISLPNISIPILAKKRDVLKAQAHMIAMVAGLAGSVPFPGVAFICDICILVTAMKEYRDNFGLTQESLKSLATKCGKDVSELKSALKSDFVLQGINDELVKSLLFNFLPQEIKAVQFWLSFIPVVGSISGAIISYHSVNEMLCKFLDDIADDAMNLLKKAVY